jgi:hypothetical protein
VPVGILAFSGTRHLRSGWGGDSYRAVPPFDGIGFTGLSLALTTILYAAVTSPQRGWRADSVWPIGLGGLCLLIAYGWWASKRRHPIVEVSFVANRQAVLALLLSAIVSVVTFGVIFLIPAFMQAVQGRTPLVAGLTWLPQGLVTGLGAIMGNQWPQRWGTRATVLLGMALLTASTLAWDMIRAGSGAWLIAGVIIGRGLVIQPLLNGLMASVPDARIPDGTTVFNLVGRVAGTVGIGLLVSLFPEREAAHVQRVARRHHLAATSVRFAVNHSGHASALFVTWIQDAHTAGFHDVMGVIASLSLVGLLLAVFIRVPNKDAVPGA